ncbi:metal-dependent hydrolase [Propioniciclava sinopodophylli]|uniref:Metal-dependent hydrolase n=1 Tax=Propioniciclava sinopodophylli TaxID=1837344 RepID=A0A4Q9KBA2_9ACTN|nr:amidohydrolase family protein [Propioniciclava sinopodophylli]TBT83027.1 metal-dependent hydrolase [Propioniciclava sinopodophylli]
MILDAHGHLGTWGDFFIPHADPAWLIATLDRVGISAIGVSHLLGVGHDARTGNRLALEASEQFAGRIGVWLVGDPHDREAVARLSDDVDHTGVWGVKLHPDTHQVQLTDERYEPLLAFAAERGLPVLTHTHTGSVWSDPALAAEVSKRHAGMPILLGHSGLVENGLTRTAAIMADHPDLIAEICGSQLTRRWLTRLVRLVGADRVVYGSDACFFDPRPALGRLLAAELTDPERDSVAGGTLARLLGHRLTVKEMHA